jgi:CCR4-NOT transcription complex subunit 2
VGAGGATGQRSGGLANYDQLLHQYHQAQLRAAGGGSLQQQQQQQLTQSARESMKGFQQGGLATPQDRFGLLGLLSVIRMSDPDLTTLALGTDLTTLGLNLNSRENLYKTFASPWADGPTRGEPEFTLPACYVQRAPRLQVKHSWCRPSVVCWQSEVLAVIWKPCFGLVRARWCSDR